MGKTEFKPDKDGKLIAFRDGKEVGWVQVYGTGSKTDQEALDMQNSEKKKQKEK